LYSRRSTARRVELLLDAVEPSQSETAAARYGLFDMSTARFSMQ